MNRFVLFLLGIALTLSCQGLMKPDGADSSPVDDDNEKPKHDLVKWMFIYCPIVLTLFSLFMAIVAYTRELNMILHLVPVLFLIIILTALQYLLQFVFTNYTTTLRIACSFLLAGIMAVVAVATPFYASWAANTGCCRERVSYRRKRRDYGIYTLPEIALGDLTIQESAASKPCRVRLAQTYLASRSSSSFDPSSPEREVQVLIHPVPISPARQSVKTSSPARCALSPTSSPSLGSINQAYSSKSDSYAPVRTASTASSHNSELPLESIPASSEDCSPVDPETLPVHTTVIVERPLGSNEDEHAV